MTVRELITIMLDAPMDGRIEIECRSDVLKKHQYEWGQLDVVKAERTQWGLLIEAAEKDTL